MDRAQRHLNLGVLFFFKYFNFGIDSPSTCWAGWAASASNAEDYFAVGISFFTFQSMSYSLYFRGTLEPCKTCWIQHLYRFFPQLFADRSTGD